MSHRDELDLCSTSFDPKKALYSALAVPPIRNARPLDNISKFRVLLPKLLCSSPLTDGARVWEPAMVQVPASRHRTKVVRHKNTSNSNVIESMMRFEEEEKGPLTWLAGRAKNRAVVRVVTRHRRGTRGVAEGNLVAFDKHMNLVLRNVKETYTVRLMVQNDVQNRMKPVLEARKRSLPNVLLMGRSVVLISDSRS